MAAKAGQATSRADTKLDASVVADYAFFTGPKSTKKHKTTILLAEGYTQREITEIVGISRSALISWKEHPDFQAVQAFYERDIMDEDRRLHDEAVRLDADTFLKSSRELNTRAEHIDAMQMDALIKMRETVRKTQPKGNIEVTDVEGASLVITFAERKDGPT